MKFITQSVFLELKTQWICRLPTGAGSKLNAYPEIPTVATDELPPKDRDLTPAHLDTLGKNLSQIKVVDQTLKSDEFAQEMENRPSGDDLRAYWIIYNHYNTPSGLVRINPGLKTRLQMAAFQFHYKQKFSGEPRGRNITVDGKWGPQTRRFLAYEDTGEKASSLKDTVEGEGGFEDGAPRDIRSYLSQRQRAKDKLGPSWLEERILNPSPRTRALIQRYALKKVSRKNAKEVWKWGPTIAAMAEQRGLKITEVFALINQESGWNPKCFYKTRREGSAGFFQINTYSHKAARRICLRNGRVRVDDLAIREQANYALNRYATRGGLGQNNHNRIRDRDFLMPWPKLAAKLQRQGVNLKRHRSSTRALSNYNRGSDTRNGQAMRYARKIIAAARADRRAIG